MMTGMSPVSALLIPSPRPSEPRIFLLNMFVARAVMGLDAASVLPVSRFFSCSMPPALVAVCVRLPRMDSVRPFST